MKTFTPEETRELVKLLRQEFEGVEECEGAVDALEYLRQARDKAKAALGYDGELDAADNLLGALIDLRRTGADSVCIQTVERVMNQIAEVYKVLAFEKG